MIPHPYAPRCSGTNKIENVRVPSKVDMNQISELAFHHTSFLFYHTKFCIPNFSGTYAFSNPNLQIFQVLFSLHILLFWLSLKVKQNELVEAVLYWMQNENFFNYNYLCSFSGRVYAHLDHLDHF
jgi:hypothetical protein